MIEMMAIAPGMFGNMKGLKDLQDALAGGFDYDERRKMLLKGTWLTIVKG